MTTGSVVTTQGKQIVINRTFNAVPTYTIPQYFSLGIGTSTPVIGDTALSYAIPITKTNVVDACNAITGWTGSADATISLNTTTYKEGTGSLNLAKTGTASSVCNMSKTTPTADFTGKSLNLWFFVKDASTLAKLTATSCVEIRYGSGSGNYYYWRKDIGDFAVGWNWIHGLTSANATGTTGTPVIGTCIYTLVQFSVTANSVVTAAGDTIVEDIYLTLPADYYAVNFVGFPIIDEATLMITNKLFLTTTQANGFQLAEFGIFNADTPKKDFSRAVHTSITKTSSVQIFYIEKDEIL